MSLSPHTCKTYLDWYFHKHVDLGPCAMGVTPVEVLVTDLGAAQQISSPSKQRRLATSPTRSPRKWHSDYQNINYDMWIMSKLDNSNKTTFKFDSRNSLHNISLFLPLNPSLCPPYHQHLEQWRPQPTSQSNPLVAIYNLLKIIAR